MKQSIQLIVSLVLVTLSLAQPARAQLIDNGDGTVYDESTGLTWLTVLLPPTGENGKTWDDAMLWADSLVFAGHEDWRLPSALDFNTGNPDMEWNSTNNEMGYLVSESLGCGSFGCDTAPFVNFLPDGYWTSTEDPQSSARAVLFITHFPLDFWTRFHIKTDQLSYTAVRGPRQAVKAPECNDGYDNDSNGSFDYPNDDGCSDAEDTSEYSCHSVFGLSCFFVDELRWWEQCFHIEDSTICIQVIYWVLIILVPLIFGIRSYKRKRSQQP